MEPLEIRVATHADIDALHALIESAYRGDSARAGWTHEADLLGGQRTDLAGLKSILDDPRQAILIATDGKGGAVACVQIANEGGGTAYLGMLSVDPKRQAGGIGRQMIAAAEKEAASRFGARRMEMTVIRQRRDLVDFYVRRGYALTGETRPFPFDDPRFGLPQRRDLEFVVLAKDLAQ